MSVRQDQLVDFLFDRLMEAGDQGMTAIQVGDALRAARLGNHKSVGWAIHALRQVLGDDVVVYDRRLRVYRRAIDFQDAERWRRLRAAAIHSQLANLQHYSEAEAQRFIESVTDTVARSAWDMAMESLRRATQDVERASLLTFGVPL